jgi:hypothetical protein
MSKTVTLPACLHPEDQAFNEPRNDGSGLADRICGVCGFTMCETKAVVDLPAKCVNRHCASNRTFISDGCSLTNELSKPASECSNYIPDGGGCFGPANADDCDCLKELAAGERVAKQSACTHPMNQRTRHADDSATCDVCGFQLRPPREVPIPPTPLEDVTVDELVEAGYSLNGAKILLAGFRLVIYHREEKTIQVSCPDPFVEREELSAFPTYAAAERALKELLQDPLLIQIDNGHKGSVLSGDKKLRDAGFESYRVEGITPGHGRPRIKSFSTGWGNWKKFETPEECKAAWTELLSTDLKALDD